MEVYINVKKFGKIKEARINISNFTVFVGNNNSGKTMVMQLIYGIRKELDQFQVPVRGMEATEMNGQYLIRCAQDWFREVERQANRYLYENKERIVKDIFGISISIEEIKIELDDKESDYFVCSISRDIARSVDMQSEEIRIDIRQYENGENTKSFEHRIQYEDGADYAVSETLRTVWRAILFKKTTPDPSQLFLPASRSGLQLLYRHYFADGTGGNMVMPIKDFLKFLQLYSSDSQLDESRRTLLEFGEEYLLQGEIIQEGDETLYKERNGDRKVPLYIASSMIHELTPFIKALGAVQKVDWLYCDEVENSLHPLLQREMARWLIRMVNAGMHVVISSHSDTMASRLNNLFMLTWLNSKKADYKMLTELELADADLLLPGVEAGVYEFRDGKQGKSIVEKLEFISCPLMGYNFSLFSKNLDKLYDEADIITRE